MEKEKLIERLKEIKRNYKANYTKIIEYKKILKPLVYKYTNFLDDDVSEAERCYCLINNISEYKICSVCKNEIKRYYPITGYRTYCSVKCSSIAIDRGNLSEETLKKRRISRKQNRNKKRIEFIKKYITNNFNLYSKEEVITFLQNKLKKNIIFYIDDLDKYSDYICSLIEHTKEIQFVKFNTIKELQLPFRVNCLLQNKSPLCKCGKIKVYYENHISDNCIECSYKNGRLDDNRKEEIRINHYKKFKEICEDFGYELLTKEKNFKIKSILEFKHKKCGRIFKRFQQGRNTILNFSNYQNLFCVFCGNGKSKPEKDLLNWCNEHITTNIITNSRPIELMIDNSEHKRELDIYIPDKDLAIEFDGIYWHSELTGNKYKNYHLEKTKLCENKGIQLLHIFENEWFIKQQIVKSIILSKVGIFERKFYARKCYIDILDTKTKNKFLEENHLQGKDNSKIKLGLFEKETNNLLSVMTFGKRKITGAKNITWELIRFANKVNITVVGGASKLFKHFVKFYLDDNEKVISYADRRYSNGKLYEKLGFELKHNSSPNYWYFHSSDIFQLMHRVNFQKHKLKNKLEIFDDNLSEWKNMKNNGYDRIWDCGNFVFEYIKQT